LETPRNATLVMDANVPPPEVYRRIEPARHGFLIRGIAQRGNPE
jgi:hypothetical protein